MAMIPLEQLITPLTVDEVKASIYRVIELSGAATTAWKPGAIVRTIIASCAIVIAALSNLAALIARSGFISLSSGLWKTLTALYVYNVARQEDTFAAGEALLSNASGFLYNIDPGDLTVKNTVSLKTYTNTTAVVLNPGALNVPCDFVADEAGSASTSLIGEVDALVTSFSGVTVTNAEAWVGLDAEDDETLQLKCDEKLGALSPMGPSDAYGFAARNAKRLDGTPIGITRVKPIFDGDLGVDTYVATATGAVGGDQDDLTTDLGAVHDAIQKNAVAMPITERTHSAVPYQQNVTYQVWMYNTKGFSEADIRAGIGNAIAQLIAKIPIGGDVIPPSGGAIYKERIITAIQNATSIEGVPLGIFLTTLSEPASNIIIGDTWVVMPGVIDGTITQLPPPTGVL